MRAIYKWSSVLALWILAMVPASAETLHAGMSGDAVTALQNSLVAAGYLARTGGWRLWLHHKGSSLFISEG